MKFRKRCSDPAKAALMFAFIKSLSTSKQELFQFFKNHLVKIPVIVEILE